LFVPIYIVIGDPITNSGKVGIAISGFYKNIYETKLKKDGSWYLTPLSTIF
jgi:hypothetical protein